MKIQFKITIITLFLLTFSGLVYSHQKEQKTLSKSLINGVSEDGSVAGTSTDSKNLDYKTKLAKHLQEKGFVLYGAFWSADVVKQKQLFGEAIQNIDYVECDRSGISSNSDECIAQKVEYYPTWIMEGVQYKGIKTLSELAQISGF